MAQSMQFDCSNKRSAGYIYIYIYIDSALLLFVIYYIHNIWKTVSKTTPSTQNKVIKNYKRLKWVLKQSRWDENFVIQQSV